MKIIKWFLLVTALFAVLVLAFLPALLSSDFVLHKVLAVVGPKIPGSLQIESCSIGWRAGLVCEQIKYTDPAQGVRTEIHQLTGSKGLLALVSVSGNLGLVTLDTPSLVLSIVEQETGERSVTASGADTTSTNGKDENASPARQQKSSSAKATLGDNEKPAIWNELTVQLVVKNGLLQFTGAGIAQTEPIEVKVKLSLADRGLAYDLLLEEAQAKGVISLTGTANLPLLMSQLADDLKTEMLLKSSDFQLAPFLSLVAGKGNIPDGSGLLKSNLKVKTSGLGELEIVGNISCESLQLHGGFLGLDRPEFERIQLDIDSRKRDASPWKILLLKLQSDFTTLSASGEFDRNGGLFAVDGILQLPLLFTHFPHLLKMRQGAEIQTGAVVFSADAKQVEQVAELQATFSADHISGKHRGKSFVWSTPTSLDLSIEKEGTDILVNTLNLSSSFLNAHAKGDNSNFSLELEADLERASSELGKLFQLGFSGSGRLKLQASGSFASKMITLHTFDAAIDHFIVNHDGITYRDKHLAAFIKRQTTSPAKAAIVIQHLTYAASMAEFSSQDPAGEADVGFQFTGKDVLLRDFHLHSKVITANVSELKVTDLQHPLQSMSGHLEAGADLAILTTLLHGAGKLDKSVSLGGNADLDVQINQVGREEQELLLEFTLQQFNLSKEEKQLLINEEIQVDLAMRGQLQGGDLVFSRLNLQSMPLVVKASGKLDRNGSQAISLHGEMLPDLGEIASIIQNVSSMQLMMSGHRFFPFDFTYPLGLSTKKVQTQAQLTTELWADQIAISGVDILDLQVPVSLERGKLKVLARGQLNKGQLALPVEGSLGSDPPLVSIADNSRILTNVQLEKALVDGVLGKLHPLFGVLAKPSGTIDLQVDNFSWPLREKGAEKADFKVVIDTSRISLESSGVLREVLTLLQIEEEELQLKEAELVCRGTAGRVECSPVKMTVAGSEMILTGSVGMDKSLDYLLEVPVTKDLIGKEGYRILAGTTLKVPIRGTIGEPDFNRDLLVSAIGDLSKQAAGRIIEKEVEKILPNLLEGLLK